MDSAAEECDMPLATQARFRKAERLLIMPSILWKPLLLEKLLEMLELAWMVETEDSLDMDFRLMPLLFT